MKAKNTNKQTTTTTTTAKTNTSTNTTFETAKRTLEQAYASGTDYTSALYDLATAIAYSVLNKCIDPQRKTAAEKDSPSDSGINPALVALKQGIAADRRNLASLDYCNARATRTTYNVDGDRITEVADKEAYAALVGLIDEPLTDGLDLVQTAAAAILEQAAEHATAENWLDRPYIVRRLSKRVYIQAADSAAYADKETTPIQEVYRAVRQAVQASRAVQTDPRNGYSYIEDLTADGLDAIYYRLHKYADLGGYNSDGLYTTDRQAAADYDSIIEALQLTDRQATIIRLRMQGKGYLAIGTYLGVTAQAVHNTMKKVQAKAEKIGFTPSMWREMTAEQ